jgi:hypothetical protein
MNNIKLIGLATITAATFIACGGGGSGGGAISARDITYTGTVDLSPIYNMKICEDQDLSNCTRTDIDGKYSLTVDYKSKLKITSDSNTKIIATSNDRLSPNTAGLFNDNSFVATSSKDGDVIVMSDSKKDTLSTSMTPTQLTSLYGVNSYEDIFDLNTTNRISLKETRDSQDYVLKTMMASYIISADKNNTSVEQLDSKLDTIIMQSWLDASKENNISISNENVLKGLVGSVITKYNAIDGLDFNKQIISIDGKLETQLKDDISIVLQAIANTGLSLENNATSSKQLYSGVNSTSFTNTIKATALLIDTDLAQAAANKPLSKLLYSAYINAFIQ